MQIGNQIKPLNVSFPDSRDNGEGALTVARAPAHAMDKPSRATAKLIGAGVAMAGAGLALAAASRMPRAEAQENVVPNYPAHFITPQNMAHLAINEVVRAFQASMIAARCTVLCTFNPRNIHSWCVAAAKTAATLIAANPETAPIAGASDNLFEAICHEATNYVMFACRSNQCRQ